MNDFHDHWRPHLTEITTKDDQPKVDPEKAAEKAADLVDKTKAPDKLKDKIEKNAADLAEKGMDPEALMAKLKGMFEKLMKMFGGAGLGMGATPGTASKQKTGVGIPGKCDKPSAGRRYCHFYKTSGYTFKDNPNSKDGIIITAKNWEEDNIVNVTIGNKTVKLHKGVANKFAKAFAEAAAASGYTPRSVQTFVPRHMRGKKSLSNHSFGTAIDLDPPLNWLGGIVRTTGAPSMMRRKMTFVKVMKSHGFIWGGDWNIKDDMHFEYPHNKL